MIDPLRPYWPTNRSIAGLLIRGFCLLFAAAMVASGASRPLTFLLVVVAASFQASLLVFEWMELKRVSRSLLVGGIVCIVFLSLVVVLVIESHSVLVQSVR